MRNWFLAGNYLFFLLSVSLVSQIDGDSRGTGQTKPSALRVFLYTHTHTHTQACKRQICTIHTRALLHWMPSCGGSGRYTSHTTDIVCENICKRRTGIPCSLIHQLISVPFSSSSPPLCSSSWQLKNTFSPYLSLCGLVGFWRLFKGTERHFVDSLIRCNLMKGEATVGLVLQQR